MLSSVFCGSDQLLFYLAVYFNPKLAYIYIFLCFFFHWHIVSEQKKLTEMDMQKLGLNTESVWETVIRSLKKVMTYFFF